MMAISPDSQRRGAGSALVESGLKIADTKHAAVSSLTSDPI